jgi:hypothetical protein
MNDLTKKKITHKYYIMDEFKLVLVADGDYDETERDNLEKVMLYAESLGLKVMPGFIGGRPKRH